MQSIKCVAIGDGAVGKTCLLYCYANDQFPEEYIPTVFDNYSRNIIHNNKQLQLSLWDTAGQEDYDQLRSFSYPETNIFLVCFSLISPTSLDNVIQKWIPEIKKNNKNTPIILVGLKCDLVNDAEIILTLKKQDKHPITTDEVKEKIKIILNDITDKNELIKEIPYFSCSSMKQIGIKELFESVVKLGLEHISHKFCQSNNNNCCVIA